MKLYTLTPAAGKRLIGKALASHPVVTDVLKTGTVIIIAGTTNGYVAEEILTSLGSGQDFSLRRFFRGITLPPHRPVTESGMLPDTSEFPGDVVIDRGVWQKGKTIFDAVNDLKEGDLIFKGANAIDLSRKRGAIFIGHPKAGTIGAALQAVVGRRVRLILPVGLEKRIIGDLDAIAEKLNSPKAKGPRFLPVAGQVFTEIDAIETMSGAQAELVAGGGVGGAEGSIWLAVSGAEDQMKTADALLRQIAPEPPFPI